MPELSGHRICPICEAACGLKVSHDGSEVIAIERNDDDVFSTGHICAKGLSLKYLHQDPDRIRKPLVRQDGKLVSASWEEALELVNRRLKDVRHASGDGSVAVYVGNPTAHNFGLSAGIAPLLRSLGSRSLFTAGTVDQVPKHLASELMFGNDMAIPVPDILHCDLLVMLGANPVVSNGSLWIVPKFRDKLRDLQKRGGRLVMVDPRRNETARLADQHIYIRPGADAVLLMAIIQRLLGKGLSVDGKYKVSGEAALFGSIRGFPLDDIEALTGISEDAVSALADDIAGASNPVIYGRVGTTLQTYGTLTSFLIEVVNLLTGSLDREGGAMFPEQPYATPSAPKRGLEYNRYQTRVSGMPEVTGQLPVSALAEEIETEGEGQIRALVTLAGNPVVSNPDSERLQKAFESLDFMVSLDIYHNETTRLADVVLPGSSPFEDVHYDAFLGSMGYKNAARYSPALISGTSEWQTMLTLSAIAATGSVPDATALAEFEDNVRVSSSVGEVTAVAELSEDIAPWVVSMPHGYSEVAGLRQAQNVSGPNYNVVAPAGRFDGPSGTTALNGIPVTVSRI